jgi:hypothetical protein
LTWKSLTISEFHAAGKVEVSWSGELWQGTPQVFVGDWKGVCRSAVTQSIHSVGPLSQQLIAQCPVLWPGTVLIWLPVSLSDVDVGVWLCASLLRGLDA